jgi:hypothetical protein
LLLSRRGCADPLLPLEPAAAAFLIGQGRAAEVHKVPCNPVPPLAGMAIPSWRSEPSTVPPKYKIFVRSKLPWVSISGETVNLDDMASQPQG